MPHNTTRRTNWQTRFGFYLLAIGSAFGLGNLWRFPYVVGGNGGGAFVLIYLFIAFIVGLPLLIGELTLGKITGNSVLKATTRLSQSGENREFKIVGLVSIFLSLLVLSYYSVISGWVLHFLSLFIAKLFFGRGGSLGLTLLMNNGWLQFLLASSHLLIAMFVLFKGVQDGLEKWTGYVMPVFAFLVIVLVVRTMSLTSSGDVLRFLFYPDFSKLSYYSLSHALGHVFFTLSLGFGSLVTFGSYLKEDEHVPTVGFRVGLVDTLISLVGLLLVFPLAFKASDHPLTDPALLFDVVPQFFLELPGGALYGLIFFLCLYLASLNASLGLLENVVSNLTESVKAFSRTQATWMTGVLVLLFAIFPALSTTELQKVRMGSKSVIESMDTILINWLLPLAVLGLSYVLQKGLKEKQIRESFVEPTGQVSFTMYTHWRWLLKYAIPAIVATGYVLQIIGLLRGE